MYCTLYEFKVTQSAVDIEQGIFFIKTNAKTKLSNCVICMHLHFSGERKWKHEYAPSNETKCHIWGNFLWGTLSRSNKSIVILVILVLVMWFIWDYSCHNTNFSVVNANIIKIGWLLMIPVSKNKCAFELWYVSTL